MGAGTVPAWIQGEHRIAVHGRRLLADLDGFRVLVHPRKLTTVMQQNRIWTVRPRLGTWTLADREGSVLVTGRWVGRGSYEVESRTSVYRFSRHSSGEARTLRIEAADGSEAAVIEAVFHRPRSSGASTAPTYTRGFWGSITARMPVESAVVGLALRLMAGTWSARTPRTGAWKWESLHDPEA